MAIIVDPDQLDRNQVIFGTGSQELSLYPVGAIISAQDTDGAPGVGTLNFVSATADFVSDAVAAGIF